MTQRATNNLPNLVILNGAQNSNIIDAYGSFSDCETFTLFGISTGDAGKTYNIQVSPDQLNWYSWSDGSANITAPLPFFAATYGNPGCRYMKIVASAVVASQTEWQMQTSYYS